MSNLDEFNIKPATTVNCSDPKPTSNSGSSTRTRTIVPKKSEHAELEELRRHVASLEAENRNLYEQAFLLQQRLETNNATEKERATFISTVAHELRTPLTSIKGYIDLVLEGETGEINPVQREFLTIVGVNANKLASIIGDLLDVSRLETGRIVLRLFLTELVGLSQALVESVRPQFEAKNIIFKPDIPLGGHLEMMADRDRLLQALRALVAQSGLYTAQGGTVTFSLNRGFEPNQAEIVISDDGPEIDPADLPKVFTKFFRPAFRESHIDYAQAEVTSTPNTNQELYTGLGLTIAKAIIEMHQGEVRVESEPGLGNRFIVTLPLLNSAESEAAVEPIPTTQPTILVVSKDEDYAQTLQSILTNEGFQVVVTQERQEVVAETPAWQPDLIIQNGQEFTDTIGQPLLETVTARRTPILTLALSSVEQRAFRAGALGVLVWPINERRLKTELAQLLGSDAVNPPETNLWANQTVLLVSPQTDVLRAFDKALRDFGFKRVYRATLQADALALAHRYKPNLLLMAIGEDAANLELFEELTSDPLLRRTPAVVFTEIANIITGVTPAYQTGEELEDNSAAFDINSSITLNTLPKPLTRRRLMSVVRRLAITAQL